MAAPTALLLAALVAGVLALACGGDGGGSHGGEPRFLLGSSAGLAELTLDFRQKSLLRYDDQSFVLDPQLSPDGRRIAFIRQPPATSGPGGQVDFGSDLYVAGRDGRDARLLAKHAVIAEFIRSPAWLSDREVAIAVRGRGPDGLPDYRIDRVDVDTGARSRFIEGALEVGVSRDGRWLAYADIDPARARERLMLLELATGSRRVLVGPEQGIGFFAALAFSPEGRRLAFAASDVGSGRAGPGGLAAGVVHPFAQDVWLIDLDGSGLHRLADLAESLPSLAWDGEGRYLYVMGGVSFWRLEPATGAIERLGEGMAAAQIAWLGER
jgi:dipeptidyl aminopeptidase/acylaminoacyl peptidase